MQILNLGPGVADGFIMESLKINYDALEKARASRVQKDLKSELKKHMRQNQSARVDSLRHTILHYVVTSNYVTAHDELQNYVNSLREYPAFHFRTHRYIKHCADLINAIKAKRNFPGLSTLSKSKQKELVEKVLEHFDELREYLKKVEKIERELKLEDMRSTVWVVKTFFHCVFGAVAIYFLYDLFFKGMGATFGLVLDDMVNKLMNFTLSLF